TRSCKQRKLTSDGIINEMNNLSQEWVFSSLTDTPTTQQRKQRKREQLIIDLFHIIWTSDNWTINEIKAAQSFLNSTEQNNDVKLSFISAVFMGTYFFFDPLKTELLIKYATHKDPHIRTRALTGLLFVLRRYSRLLFCIPETTQHFLQLTREKGFQKELIHFQLSVLSQNTKDIEKKINNDILPAIKKSNQTVIDLEQINDLLNEDDIPDSIINDEIKELHNKLNDLMELHNNGADMSYFSFSHLKKFPFFQSPANWFLPFSIDHSQLDSNIISNNSFVKFLLENNEMCDSDKYSFCLMLSHLPQAQWDNMQDRFKQQFGESMPDQDISTDINIQRHYVQDCYRFFMLYHNRTGINNPFESDPLLLNNPLFAPLFMDKDVLLRIANFCYKRKFWKQAADTYDFLNQHYTLSQESLQIFGYVLQKLNKYDEALLCYEKSSLINSESTWTLKHMGTCYLKLEQYSKALHVYSRLMHFFPDDQHSLLRYGECLIHIGKHEKALEVFYKSDYLYPNHLSTQEAIGWCNLQIGNAQQACKYFFNITAQKPTYRHFLWAGNSYWANKNIQNALHYYQQAAHMQPNHTFSFDKESKDILLGYGITDTDIQFMLDIINLSSTDLT
ncbi:MAG: tetratricopeptide repeat protein, partial [Bacteroidaceae bacterium]|nr:tetratricopeptide repeat protein [Bacteroidaceae bacterium]